MRRPTCSTTLAKRQPAQKPKFSQRSGRQDFTLGGMSVSQPKRARQTQGIALVIVLLSAMILMVSLLAISATMTISSQRTTADQKVTLPAQYAAEAGLARAQNNLSEAQALMGQISVVNSSRTKIETHAKNYCSGGAWTSAPSNYNSWTVDQKTNGVVLCTAPAGASNQTPSIFTDPYYSLQSPNVYPSGLTATTYWNSVFSQTPTQTTVASANGSQTVYTLSYGLKPTRVILQKPNFYRFEFLVADTVSTGEMKSSSQIFASRKLQEKTSGTYYFDVQLPSFARNFVFRDETTNTSGQQLYFAGGETFNGPVHTNKTPGFYKLTTTPTFTSDFTSCAAKTKDSFAGYSSVEPESADMRSTFQGSDPLFGLSPCIDLPTNSNNQKRAAFSGDPGDATAVTEDVLQAGWSVRYGTTTTTTTPDPSNPKKCDKNPTNSGCKYTTTTTTTPTNMPNGVYYSKGDGAASPNQAASWNNDVSTNLGGGVYIRGDVDALKLCTNSSKRQIIGITQGTTTTTFEENSNGTWTVKTKSSAGVTCNATPGSSSNGTTVKTLSGKFNGMVYIDGDVADLRGDGSDTPDVAANSKLTIASTGKVLIKDSITYTDVPTEANKKTVTNILGIYSSGDKCDEASPPATSCGSILVDGADKKDVEIHASIMATKQITNQGYRKGEGFGAVRYATNLGLVGGQKARIKLLGGVIERQSQTVGGIGDTGYARAYSYDPRFADGIAPPFYPEQADGGESAVISRWTTSVGPFATAQEVWQAVGK